MKNSCHKVDESMCLPPDCKYINGPKLKYCRKVSAVKTKKTTSVKTQKQSSVRTTVRCKKLSQADCLPPDCKYVNGLKLKYCKNATTLKRQTKVKTPSLKMKTPTPPPKKDNTKMAAQKIQAFIHKKRGNITAFFLNSVCQDSGTCFAFGKESTKIKLFFDNFSNFKYAVSHKQISSGGNGDVHEIEYDRLNYKSFAILKIAKNTSSDNLFYEYLTGLFINSMYKKTPSLLETYGLYNLLNSSLGDLSKLSFVNTNSQQEIESAVSLACLQPTKLCNLIEHIKGSFTLYKMLIKPNFAKYDLIYALFQVYFTLNMMKDLFTHYDLHASNVLVYIPVPDKYIQYHYHFTTGTVSFKSPYIVKIIDYGRSYFNNTSQNIDSESIRKLICQQPDCNIPPSKCGKGSGFKWLNAISSKAYSYLNSSVINRSYDLRLLITLIEYLKIHAIHPTIIGVTQTIKKNNNLDTNTNKNINILFGRANINYEIKNGTPQLLTSGLPKKIHNVMDAFALLKTICMNQSFINQNNTCYYMGGVRHGFKKIGDLHIYDDNSNKDMEFIAA